MFLHYSLLSYILFNILVYKSQHHDGCLKFLTNEFFLAYAHFLEVEKYSTVIIFIKHQSGL